MTHSTDDDLVALLRGDLDRDDLTASVAHLRQCPSCRDALVDAAQVHGALEAAARLLRGPVGGQPVPAGALPALPPLPALRARGRRQVVRWVAVAAAAAVVAGSAVAAVTTRDGGQRPPQVSALSLGPLSGNGSGRVTMKAESATPTGSLTEMVISTQGLPLPRSGQFYYAWLLDPLTQKMLPLGVVDPSGGTTFEVAADLVGRYHAVDISLQVDDGNPRHSATSVLRGTY